MRTRYYSRGIIIDEDDCYTINGGIAVKVTEHQ
jgi:hypothetical protein